MSIFDWGIIVVYLVVMLYIGIRAMRKVKTKEDFVLGGKTVGPVFMLLSLFASWTGLSGLFGTPQYVYTYGIAGGWWWFTFPIGVYIMGMTMAKVLRRRMHRTLPDIVDSNHTSKAVRVAASAVTVWNYLAWTAGQVAGIMLIIRTFTDLNPITGVIITYVVMIVFTMLGGFRAVVNTDAFQSILFLAIIGVVIPILILTHYSPAEIYAQTSNIQGYYSLFASVPAGTMFTWWMLAPSGFIDTMAFQRIFAARDESSAKKSINIAFALMVIFGSILTFIGVASRVILPADIDPSGAMLLLVQNLLPKGMLGLIVAAFVGVAMSTASTTLLVCSTTIEQDIYSVVFAKSEKETDLKMNRILVILIGFAALIFALKVPSVTTILQYGYSVYVPGLLFPVIAGTFDIKIQDKYVLATIVLGAVTSILLVVLGEPIPASVGGLIAAAIPFVMGLVVGKKNIAES